ncbi:MAG: hypothetical protein J6R26_00150 [Paludibacteraceae bacterium]|nr:hypothetical protein [Paludibacteraceae bacterium]
MKTIKYILLTLNILLSTTLLAEVVVLKTGRRVEGEIILQNDEVVIIKKKDGTRYQCPREEILAIEESTSETEALTNEEANSSSKRVSLRAQMHGGAVYIPFKGWGGQIGVDMMMGSKEIGEFPIFLGGSIGYRAKMIEKTTYSFIPLQVALATPLNREKQARHIAMNIGYGFSTNKSTKGGICLTAAAGWIYHFNSNSSLILSGSIEWQQTQTEVIETIEGQNYSSYAGNNFFSLGANIAIQF